MDKKLKLSPPWITYFKEIEAMFKEDPKVRVELNEESKDGVYVIKMYVEGSIKAEAIEKIIPAETKFGNITVLVEVIPANISDNPVDLFKAAFEGNPALSYIHTVEGPFMQNASYIVFKNKVVQFFNDALDDVNGMKSTLYQEIAKEIFQEHPDVYFCTDAPEIELENSKGEPLREWP